MEVGGSFARGDRPSDWEGCSREGKSAVGKKVYDCFQGKGADAFTIFHDQRLCCGYLFLVEAKAVLVSTTGGTFLSPPPPLCVLA